MQITRRLYPTTRRSLIYLSSSSPRALAIRRYASEKDDHEEENKSLAESFGDTSHSKPVNSKPEKASQEEENGLLGGAISPSTPPKDGEHYHSFKEYREGPNPESGEWDMEHDPEEVVKHNKDLEESHKKT